MAVSWSLDAYSSRKPVLRAHSLHLHSEEEGEVEEVEGPSGRFAFVEIVAIASTVAVARKPIWEAAVAVVESDHRPI